MTDHPRIFLSSPHLGEWEQKYVQEAFDTNWIAPLGPNVDGFEQEFCEIVGSKHAAALSAGTAALHLSLILNGVGPGDEVIVSSLTFVASANPVLYVGATPVFIDSELNSWNMDANLLAEFLAERAKVKRVPKALMLVHLYGQTADIDPILALCEQYGIVLIEDAAEALGATYKDRIPGTQGQCGIYSFNGNKIITTSGGGMLVSDDEDFIKHARKLATQARDPAPYYQHTEIGYNYRMSNIVAGIGRGQLKVLKERVAARRANYELYLSKLGAIQGVQFQPEADWGTHTRWLTCLTIDDTASFTREDLRLAMEAVNIEARPVWKPMHMQPLFEGCEMIGGAVSEQLFEQGICLPSGSNLSASELDRVIQKFKEVAQR